MKFGAFYEFLEAEHGARFDRIASGHYARVIRDPDNPTTPVRLALTPDPVKDQTYFLAHLTQQQLSRTIFPLGTLTKVGTPACCPLLHVLADDVRLLMFAFASEVPLQCYPANEETNNRYRLSLYAIIQLITMRNVDHQHLCILAECRASHHT